MNNYTKIAYLSNNPNLGSTARVFLDWIHLAREFNYRPRFLLQSRGPLYDWLGENAVEKSIVGLAPLSRRDIVGGFWRLCKAFYILRQWRPRILHCMEHNVYPFAWRLGRLLKVPVVCHVQYRVDRGFCEWAFGHGHAPNMLIWTAASQRADCEESVKGIIEERHQVTLPMGIGTREFGKRIVEGRAIRDKFGVPHNAIVFGTACAFRRRKRITDFIELVSRLQNTRREVYGLIAGGPVADEKEYAAEIKRLVSFKKLESKLFFVGDIVDIEPFHQATDVSVSTSEYETFGMSVCEAMACAKPVIGYVGGSVAEVVGDPFCIVPTGDLDGLENVARSLVFDEGLRATFGTAARSRVEEHFAPDRTFLKLHRIYQELIHKSEPSRRA